ncbi:MAG: DUF192 domain-containing protein [Candidatus Omnitrophica bacterium]|nr:DUF192 domain-containing protein [Candidatus Omnitrophota bacterium]
MTLKVLSPFLILFLANPAIQPATAQETPLQIVEFVNGRAVQTRVEAQIAYTAKERYQGLSGREFLDEGQGMIFVYDAEQFATFTMRGMQFAIDMIFVKSSGKVAGIVHEATPCREEPCPTYRSPEKIRWVLEVPAGYAAANGITSESQMVLAEFSK